MKIFRFYQGKFTMKRMWIQGYICTLYYLLLNSLQNVVKGSRRLSIYDCQDKCDMIPWTQTKDCTFKKFNALNHKGIIMSDSILSCKCG